jgi:hypothetical protein
MALAACGGGSPTAPSNTVDFQGVWQGTWLRASCTGSACDVVPASGGLRITLTQAGNQVQGSVEWASFFIPVSGSVSASGALSLAGQAHLGQGTETVSNWSTTRSGNTMNGGFTITAVPDSPATGSQVVQLTLQNVAKTS